MEKEKEREEVARSKESEVRKNYDEETYNDLVKKLAKKPFFNIKLTNILRKDLKALKIFHMYIKQGKRLDQLTKEEYERIPLRTRIKIEAIK